MVHVVCSQTCAGHSLDLQLLDHHDHKSRRQNSRENALQGFSLSLNAKYHPVASALLV